MEGRVDALVGHRFRGTFPVSRAAEEALIRAGGDRGETGGIDSQGDLRDHIRGGPSASIHSQDLPPGAGRRRHHGHRRRCRSPW